MTPENVLVAELEARLAIAVRTMDLARSQVRALWQSDRDALRGRGSMHLGHVFTSLSSCEQDRRESERDHTKNTHEQHLMASHVMASTSS
jgi:hypothetical protein